MIYTVELNFTDQSRVDEWNAWYETYLMKLISLPGLFTAQRFRAVDAASQKWEYLALYSIASMDVYDSDAYRNIGGGGNASAQYKDSIHRRRNVYTGIERFPEVSDTCRVVLSEDVPHGYDFSDCLFLPLSSSTGRRKAGASEIDGQPSRRAIAVVDGQTAEGHRLTCIDALAVYTPITKRYTSNADCT